MIKKSILLSLFIVALTSSTLFSEEPDENLHIKCLYPTVLIQTYFTTNSIDVDKQPPAGHGAGVIISSLPATGDLEGCYLNVVLTCDHVVVPHNLETVRKNYGERYMPNLEYKVALAEYENWSVFKKYDWYRAKVFNTWKDHDISLMTFISRKQMPTAEVSFDYKLYIGSHITKVGCGLGEQPRVEFGRVTSLNPTGDIPVAKDTFRLSVTSVPGDSGGPVYHENKLIGIISFIRFLDRNYIYDMSYMQPNKHLKTWMDEDQSVKALVEGKKLEAPYLEQALQEILPLEKPNSEWLKELESRKLKMYKR